MSFFLHATYELLLMMQHARFSMQDQRAKFEGIKLTGWIGQSTSCVNKWPEKDQTTWSKLASGRCCFYQPTIKHEHHWRVLGSLAADLRFLWLVCVFSIAYPHQWLCVRVHNNFLFRGDDRSRASLSLTFPADDDYSCIDLAIAI